MTEDEYFKLDMQVKILKICKTHNITTYKELVNFMLDYTPHDPDDIVGAEEDTSIWIFKKEWCNIMKYVLDERSLFIDYLNNARIKK